MCGIAGIWKFNSVLSKETLGRFTDSMHHRGPDGAGYDLFCNNTLGLGHRRLAILDLTENGHQPMYSADGRYAITYNGEVFNFSEIKEELVEKGYHFYSHTDTEVILASYQEWGVNCLDRFNGMWAFAIWDSVEEELFLARDRFGIKPLYYVFARGEGFYFASETRAFKFLDGYQRKFSIELLNEVKLNEYALEGIGYTIFEGIYQLLPGHYAKVKYRDTEFNQNRWWSILDANPKIPESEEERIEQFHELFVDACKLRLVSDVPLATALSGGLDSTSVYCTISRLLESTQLNRVNPNSHAAFTAVFPGLKNDETKYAEEAASFCGKAINAVSGPTDNLVNTLIEETELADYIGNPISSISAVYKGMKAKGISVSMDGHGVDEMLFGYRGMINDLYYHYLGSNTRKASEVSEVLIPLYHPDEREAKKVQIDIEIAKAKELSQRFKRKMKALFGKNEDWSHRYIPLSLPPLSDKPYYFSKFKLEKRMLYFEFFQHTLPALLRNFDRAGMMNSVEIRMPFMDYRLVEYVFGLNEKDKMGEAFTKLILRKAMKGKMPETLRSRTFKVGISSPLETWYQKHIKDSDLFHLAHPISKGGELNQATSENNLTARAAWGKINMEIIQSEYKTKPI